MFRLITVALVLTPLLILEIGLRVAGYPPRDQLAVDPIFDPLDPKPLFESRDSGQTWSIPESRHNFFAPASFSNQSDRPIRRIFVLGGSTVQGRPWHPPTAFPAWTQLFLQACDPAHDYQVINCGGVSYASYRVAKLLDEVLQHQPAAIVIYTGHNEFLEQRSYPATDSIANQATRLAQSSHLVRAIQHLQHTPTRDPSAELQTDAPVTRLDLMDGMDLYQRDDAWRQAVVAHFQRTLDQMAKRCRQADVPLILCQPASDRVDTAPFKIMPAVLTASQTTHFDTFWEQARNGQLNTDHRIESCQQVLGMDPQHAGANFVLGKLLIDQGQFEIAKPHLLAARDHDVCPLRATSAIEMATKQVASLHQLELVRCDELLDARDLQGQPRPDGIPDTNRFVDHIHPSIAGHQLIGQAIAKRLAEQWRLACSNDVQAQYESLVQAQLSSLEEAYFTRGKQRLQGLRRWASGRSGKLHLPANQSFQRQTPSSPQ
ncbi:SGNH/GDSL hydrolase family protein [Planctomycetes bacterium SV_7m_r]